MTQKIDFLPLIRSSYNTYIEVGTEAYNQHYLHLWKNADSSPYLKSSFTKTVLDLEMGNQNTELFVIHKNELPVGILKITKNSAYLNHTAEEALLLDKIYILKEHTGKGIGKQVFNFVDSLCKRLNKKVLWLDTMKNGRALEFYLKNGFEIAGETVLEFPNVIDQQKDMYILMKRVEGGNRI